MNGTEKIVGIGIAMFVMFLIILTICLNATNWIALTNNYCQVTVQGSQYQFWQKCEKK